jgi:hypothetical protein
MGEKRNAYRILVGKPERPLGRPRSKWEDDSEMDLESDMMGRYAPD